MNDTCEHCIKGGYTYSKEFMYECLVRYFCTIPTLEARQKFLNAYDRNYGGEAGKKIRADIKRVWVKK